MKTHLSIAAMLTAALCITSATSAHAGWKLSLVKKSKVAGTLQPVALSDSGIITGIFTTTDGLVYGATGNHLYLNLYSMCGTGAETLPAGIDSAGDQAGTCYLPNTGQSSGYLFSVADDSNTYIYYPGSLRTGVNGTSGTNVAGAEVELTPSGAVSHGFIYNIASATYQRFDPPGSVATLVQGISPANAVYGTYYDSNSIPHAYIYQNGITTTLDLAGYQILPFGINASNQVVGWANNGSTTVAVSWQNGHFTMLNPPSAAYSLASGVNASGQVTGYYATTGNEYYGFSWTPSNGNVAYFAPPAGAALSVNAINASGQIAGTYETSSLQPAFIASCTGRRCN